MNRWKHLTTAPVALYEACMGKKGNMGRAFLGTVTITSYLTSLFTALDQSMWLRLLIQKMQNKLWCWVVRMKVQHRAKIKPALSENVYTRDRYTRLPEWKMESYFQWWKINNDLWNLHELIIKLLNKVSVLMSLGLTQHTTNKSNQRFFWWNADKGVWLFWHLSVQDCTLPVSAIKI